MSLSRLYSVYCEGRYLTHALTGDHAGEHAEGCPTFSPNMSTSKEARAEARRQGWQRIQSPTLGGRVKIDLSPQCHARYVAANQEGPAQ